MFENISEFVDAVQEHVDSIWEIYKESRIIRVSLENSLGNDYNAINDIIKLYRMQEKMSGLTGQVTVTCNVIVLCYQIENDKDRFLVQKYLEGLKEELKGDLDALIRICRTWKYMDYRCIDLTKRWAESLIKVKKVIFED